MKPSNQNKRFCLRRKLRVVMLSVGLLAVGLIGVSTIASAQPAALIASPQAAGLSTLEGEGQLRFFGMRIYDARLWVGSQFNAASYAEHPLALELIYHRAFQGSSIAERSIQEIDRQQTLDASQAARWQQDLAQWLPDVKPGDSLVGLYIPGRGMRLWRGKEAFGMINDAELARRFFGIWLSPQTSEPALRRALIAKTTQKTP